jgi:hypothetical protein
LKLDLLNLFAETVSAPASWPLQHFPAGWLDSARESLTKLDNYLGEYPTLNVEYLRVGSTIHTLVTCLRACVRSAGGSRPELKASVVGLLKKALGCGLILKLSSRAPSPVFQRRQREADAMCTVIERLAACDPQTGLHDPSTILAPVGSFEIADWLKRAVGSCRIASLEEIVSSGLVSSSEMRARLVPSLVAAASAQSYADASLRHLSFSLHQAFAKRRSLLLLNLESQVRIDELPWARVLKTQKAPSDAQRATIELLVVTALTHFPQTILPNKLISSLQQLVREAQLEIPLTEELAADIFMGEFSAKNGSSAQITAERMLGSLYANHYGLDVAFGSLKKNPSSDRLADFAFQLAGRTDRLRSFSPILNSRLIEQAQLLTTHNLIPLITKLRLNLQWAELVVSIFRWMIKKLVNVPSERHPRIIFEKNFAYAWRQLVVFLSLLDDADQQAVISRLSSDELQNNAKLGKGFERCLEIFLKPLNRTVQGHPTRPPLGLAGRHWFKLEPQ